MEKSVERHSIGIRDATMTKYAEEHILALGNQSTNDSLKALVIYGMTHEKDTIMACCMQMLVDVGKPSVEPLIKYGLTNAGHNTQWYSMHALGEIGDEKAAEPIAKLCVKHAGTKNNLVNYNLFIKGLEALTKINSVKALPKLMTLTGHEYPKINIAVKSAIQKIQEANDA